jgi:two-component system, cell cycle response regulator
VADAALILLIDDVPGSRAELARVVTSLGYRTAEASNGLQALQLIKKLRPSLVLLDIVMPIMDGFKIAAAIKTLPVFVPVILLTGLDDLDSRRRGQAAGADDFLAKPIASVELQIRIAAMLRIKSLTDALEDARTRLAEQADTDPLTGIANRRSFERALDLESGRALRYQHPVSLVMLDIDHFKRVNDTHGHAAGDSVIRAVAHAIRDESRNTDKVARIGGEEFAAMLPETDMAGTCVFAERLRIRVSMLAIAHEGQVLRVTASLGSATWAGTSGFTPHDLLLGADEALYASKRSGRNRHTTYHVSSDKLAV